MSNFTLRRCKSAHDVRERESIRIPDEAEREKRPLLLTRFSGAPSALPSAPGAERQRGGWGGPAEMERVREREREKGREERLTEVFAVHCRSLSLFLSLSLSLCLLFLLPLAFFYI